MDIHVWAAGLDPSPERVSAFKETLAPDELERAARFHFEIDRNRFIAGRGILREILGSYLGIRPERLQFDYSPHGKPTLKASSTRPPLHFNLGHSVDLILIAVTRACPLGIDVEWVRPIPDLENIATRYFSTREAAELMALPEERRPRAFYQLWTRKEACLKASGEGLSGLAGLQIPDHSKLTDSRTLVEFTPARDFIGAIAAPAGGLTVSCWSWPSH
ncbi:MAG TPA: 4'-phosphopantetheinyl transferase superfamily protein [Candidatus Sulfotelmatobacter sp.]|nr:4'-phosphopantetheinyl transferase superfamily protein [Candidatus Sulfotelmatobacter sp.]